MATDDELEAQQRDARRMEIVGRLATALAHDFNNILAIIVGSASLLELQLKDAAGPRKVASEIGIAAHRGTELWKQLLAFGRAEPRLPAHVPVDLASTLDDVRRAQPTRARPLTILLVDDAEQVRTVIATMLELDGHRMLQAGSAGGAFAHWAEHGAQIDLLLADVRLRGELDGPALASELRRDRPELPVILTSTLPIGEKVQERVPDCDYLQKPFDLADLNAILTLRFR